MKKILFYLLLFAWAGLGTMNAQTITGQVTGEQDKQPLPGVAVVVKNSTTGTFTDGNGKYSVPVPSLNATLVFSFVGMNTIEIPVNNRTVIDVSMVAAVLGLEEVLVTAYGTAKRIEFTGSASVAKKELFEKVVSSNVFGALQGTVSGVQIKNISSQPGSVPQIRIRGISSINGNASPLIVLNGAPFGGELNSINLNDVESISVLKDANATALYGSRASAGVLLITTKKGAPGKPAVTFKATYGISDLAMPLHKRVNNAQYYEMRWEASKNGYLDRIPAATLAEAEAYAHANLISKTGGYNSYDRYPLLLNGRIDPDAVPRWGSGPSDWEDALFKPAPRTDTYFSIAGGTPDGLIYNLSLGHLDEVGAWSASGFRRTSTRLDISKKFGDIIEIGLNTAFSYGLYKIPPASYCFRFITDMPDIFPIYQWDDANNTYLIGPDGKKVLDMGSGKADSYNGYSRATWANVNPFQIARDNRFHQTQSTTNSSGFVSISPIKGLNLRSQLNVDTRNNLYTEYYSSQYAWASSSGGRTIKESLQAFVYTFSNLISYKNTFGAHSINILAGLEAYSRNNERLAVTGIGFPLPTLFEIGAASTITQGDSYLDKHRIQSYLSKFDYNYAGKYFLSASFRRDGTSRFAPESRWGNFGSVGASWRISKEGFLENLKWLSDLSLRASIGSQGNEDISGFYAHIGTFTLTQQLGTTALQLNSLTNSELKWEKNIQTNFGFTANFFSRINLGFDYFIKNSQGLLFNRELPLSTGLVGVAENIGDIRNKGFELELQTHNLAPTSKFRWETFFNLSSYKNEITRLPSTEISAGYYRYKVGVSAYEFYLREWRGVSPTTGKNLWTQADGTTTEVLANAVWDYRGTSLPDFFGNVMNNVSYKGIDLSVNVIYSFGGQIYDYLQSRLGQAGSRNIAETFGEFAYDYWTPTNTDAKSPRLSDYGVVGNDSHQSSTRWLWDATYARVRNITFGYTLPTNLVSKIKATNVRVFVQADNLITWFKGKEIGLDPEQDISGELVFTRIPPMKTVISGITVNF